MTTAEALLAMKIGCKVIPTTWTINTNYYDLQGNSVCYVHKTLNFVSLACDANEFIEKYSGIDWKLYDC